MNECCPYLLTGVARLAGLKTYRQLPGFYSRQLYVRHPFSFFHIARFPAIRGGGYPAKIHALSAYLTPSCRELMEGDARRRKDAGELLDRVRVVYEIPEHGYGGRYNKNPVTVQGRDNWLVRLDLVADEYFHAEPVKRALVRYPLKVVRWEGDPEHNPFGLALDCYSGTPQRLEAAPVSSGPGGAQ